MPTPEPTALTINLTGADRDALLVAVSNAMGALLPVIAHIRGELHMAKDPDAQRMWKNSLAKHTDSLKTLQNFAQKLRPV